jgi:kynurenine formamidase
MEEVLTLETVKRWGRELSNWGRWGTDDQLGTLNLLTPERVRRAASLVRSGRVISCAIDFSSDGPMPADGAPGHGRFNPVLTMTQTGVDQHLPGGFQYADDELQMTLQAATQWDALAHAFYDDTMYNGWPSSLIDERGASVNSIYNVRHGIAGRGVLLDIARHRGVPALDDGVAIQPGELNACAAAQGVRVEVGDILLVRTGRAGRARREGSFGESFVFGPTPGLSVRCAHWLREHDVAAVAADNIGVEVLPGEVPDALMPLHMICLRDMGLTFGEIFDLDEVAESCSQDNRWDFFFTAPPLPIVGAVGSPINPLAIL